MSYTFTRIVTVPLLFSTEKKTHKNLKCLNVFFWSIYVVHTLYPVCGWHETRNNRPVKSQYKKLEYRTHFFQTDAVKTFAGMSHL